MSELDPDATLIARVGCGDQLATRMLVAAKLPRMLALATRMLHDGAEAEDVTQEAFVRIWRTAAAWRPGRARFDTWLHTVVLNLCHDRLRKRRDLLSDVMPETADPAPDAETELIETERGHAVSEAIAALPERQREAILLVHYQDLSGPEAAAALEISVEALESLLARGRRSLRGHFAAVQELAAHD
ncbi:RNA polymerase sigma factor [Sphingomonas sp. PAMC 26605]|uniref:RNA polymerase sigma factor n=1 Tax=Sphingomonas sp. PAMC 26605 TaxID=1112214 RepID=UPI00026CD1FA|nr:RNA polymerase sigma factor [Sphingomonas sp. PAMC 26605]